MRQNKIIGKKAGKAAEYVMRVGAALTVTLCFFGRTSEAIVSFFAAALFAVLLFSLKAAAERLTFGGPEDAGDFRVRETELYKQDGHEVFRSV